MSSICSNRCCEGCCGLGGSGEDKTIVVAEGDKGRGMDAALTGDASEADVEFRRMATMGWEAWDEVEFLREIRRRGCWSDFRVAVVLAVPFPLCVWANACLDRTCICTVLRIPSVSTRPTERLELRMRWPFEARRATRRAGTGSSSSCCTKVPSWDVTAVA